MMRPTDAVCHVLLLIVVAGKAVAFKSDIV